MTIQHPTRQELEQWADPRETSIEVAEAIWWLAGVQTDAERAAFPVALGNTAPSPADEAQRIWNDPTREEWLAVWGRVTGNGLRSGHDYRWGVSALGDEFASGVR